MRLKILLIVVIVGLFCLLAAANNDHKVHEQQADTRTAQAKKLQSEVQILTKANDQMITEYNSLWDQCEKGVANYNLMTVVERAKAVMPNCGVQYVK